MTERWVADARIGWRILLTARAEDPLDPVPLALRLRALYADQDWGESPGLEHGTDVAELRLRLAAAHAAPLRVACASDTVVLSAHHAAADGLALLQVLDGLGLGPATSSSRGVADRAGGTGLLRTVGGRLAEVLAHPPARVTTPSPVPGLPGDVLLEREVAGRPRTADLVHAAAQGVVRHEAERGRTARHVAVAVGAGRPPVPGEINDRSALIRLTDVEHLDRAQVAELVRTAPLETPPAGGEARPWTPYVDRGLALGIRLLAPRLGSTLLVSHLGEVTAPALARLAFAPVTAGGTGLSLGAVGLAGQDRTVLTLRGRAAAWDDDGLEQLLEAVISLL
ncbi:MAG TPA: hypothetical protein VNS81_03890 [Nocardioides sp.]|nr:hypothetical protein [Nocardioides sp.]